VFRSLEDIAPARLCEKILAEIPVISADESKSFHERYGTAFGHVKDRDKDVALAFDGLRRSQALFKSHTCGGLG